MRKEKLKIKCPKRIQFGDPLYYEDFKNEPERLKKLVVDYKPNPEFKAGVLLTETEYPEFPGYMARTMTVYFAPEQHLPIYMDEKMYASQKTERKEIGVDTACYLIEVDPVYRDIKEKKICIIPALICVALGLILEAVSGGGNGWQWLAGMVPGGVLMLSGRLFNDCIGSGDIILILGLGLLEGFYFCVCSLAIAGAGIFVFSVGALLSGRLHRNSRVAFVPFLVFGYAGAGLL